MRTYELMFIIDPRVSDEDAEKMVGDYRKMIEDGGGTVVKHEDWGKRRLAYPINKLSDGRYELFYVSTEEKTPLPEVERRMGQNEQILRSLTVRTDLERIPAPEPEPEEAAEPESEPTAETAGGAE